MALTEIKGGYQLSSKDEQLLNKQRAITKQINDRFIQVGAIFLKASSKNPFDPDGWAKSQHRDTDLQSWIDDEELRSHNVGFNLQQGWLDVDIDAEDSDFNHCVIAALQYLQIDERFKFGRLSVGYPTHVLVQLGEEESTNFDYLHRFEPNEFRIDGRRYHVQLRSMATNADTKNAIRSAKQTVMPGSIYSHKSESGAYDISVWYGNNGIAADVSNVAATTPRRVNFNEIVRAVTFATFLYCVKDEWVEGSRQMAAQKLGGWLARVVSDSQAMNNHESISTEVYCPVDTEELAERLIEFVCEYQDDDEKHMRIRAFRDARDKLNRNPDAKIPGWPTIDAMLGGERTAALRTVFMPGSDVSQLTRMADRYVYDEADNKYIDRDRFFTTGGFIHDGSELERRHKGDTVRVGGKPKEAFKVFESSDMRKRVGGRDLYPDIPPGSINRISSIGEVLSDEDDDDYHALPIFNTWRGWPIDPTSDLDEQLLNDLILKLDKLLGYLTRDNIQQINWIKQWISWTFQHPGDKQQIAWVVVGEQGVGKSWFGDIFMKAMMGPLWGIASTKVLDGDFVVGPFVNKMFVFIDEAKAYSDAGTDEIKKLVRAIDVGGMEKFQDARNYQLYARMMFASNRFNMKIGQTDMRDRALFYTRAYDREFLKMTEPEFRTWAETLKPFFTDFTKLMKRRDVREHFMHYFMHYETTKMEVESIKFSSSGDEEIVISNMSWARRIAKYIIEEGRIYEDLDISYPFTRADLNKRVAEVAIELGFSRVQGDRVLNEFDGAGIIEKVVVSGQKKIRFTHKIGDITKSFGEAISAPMEPHFEFSEEDFGVNDNNGDTPTPWKGNRRGVVQRSKNY